jgi:hypothetical protein
MAECSKKGFKQSLYVHEFKVKHEDYEDINGDYKNHEIELLVLKVNTISEMKNSLDGLNSIVNITEERIKEFEDIAIKAIQIKTKTENSVENNE